MLNCLWGMISHYSMTARDHFFPRLLTIISFFSDSTNFYHDSFIVSIVLPKLPKFFSLHSTALKVWKTMNFQFQHSIDEKRDSFWQSDIKTHFKILGKSRFFKFWIHRRFFDTQNHAFWKKREKNEGESWNGNQFDW